uniref:Secreted protein n=1 Tax=Steinernema glaseri TaxID=37863 RepID=A0A1I7ZNH3_9BILA
MNSVLFAITVLAIAEAQLVYTNLDGILAAPLFINTHPAGRTVCDFEAGFLARIGNPPMYYQIACEKMRHDNEASCTACCRHALSGQYAHLKVEQVNGLLVKRREVFPVKTNNTATTNTAGTLKPLETVCGCCGPL